MLSPGPNYENSSIGVFSPRAMLRVSASIYLANEFIESYGDYEANYPTGIALYNAFGV